MPPRLPQLESLRVLEACVRHQNMTRAARELGVTPAAVSLRIRNLEEELGASLFVRAGPRIAATSAATVLAERIGSAIAELRDAVEASRTARVQITITAVPTLASRWLTAALTDYQRLDPKTDVVLDSSDTVRPAGSFDVALRHGRGGWKGLAATEIFSGEATPMMAPELARRMRTAGDLARLPLVPDRRWRSWFAKARSPVGNLKFTVDYPSQELAAAAIVAGAGAALLSPLLFASLVTEGKLARPFKETVSESERYFIAVAEHEQRAQVLHLRDFLVAHAGRIRA